MVHPNHGIGTITKITKLDLLDEFSRYYVINFLANNLTSRIPVKKISDMGLRKTMSPDKSDQVLEILQNPPQELPGQFKIRKKVIEDLITSGKPLQIAKAVRELTWRKNNTRLSVSDGQMLTKGRNMLIEEIALVTGSNANQARQKIDEALFISVELGQSQPT